MKILKWINKYRRQIWWFLLTGGNAYLIIRYHEILFTPPFSIDQLSIVTMVALLFMPLVKEFSFGSLKIKKEIETTRAEIKKDLSDFKFEMINSNLSNSLRQNLYVYPFEAPSREELNVVTQDIDEVEGDEEDSNQQIEVSQDEHYLFEVRQKIEKIVKRITTKHRILINSHSVAQFIFTVYQLDFISAEVYHNINQVMTICNRGIHGEIVDQEYIDFVKKMFPTIQRSLESALEKGKMDRFIASCPRCKYSGSSYFDDQCPACGYLFVDN